VSVWQKFKEVLSSRAVLFRLDNAILIGAVVVILYFMFWG